MRHGKVEQANALAIRIGHNIARRNAEDFSHMGSKTTSKELWDAVKKLKRRAVNKVPEPAGLDAEIFNKHYAQISTDLSYVEPRLKSTASIHQDYFTEYQIYQLLIQLKRTATGLDSVPAWFLKMAAPFVSGHLTYLFNRSLCESTVPRQWTTAYIRPVPKTANTSGPVDYRPISVTPVLSRTFEKLVVKEFIYPAILNPPPILCFADQYAFRPGGSCTAAIIALLQTISTMLIDNSFVVVISLDFSKAFDTVRHAAVTDKMSMLSIPDSVYNWIVSYFTEHEHCTVYEGEVSEFQKVNASVIQGSSIGPSSYDVVASDLHPVVEQNKLVKFADDFDLIIPGCNVDSRGQELDNVQTWSVANNLQLNRQKSKEI